MIDYRDCMDRFASGERLLDIAADIARHPQTLRNHLRRLYPLEYAAAKQKPIPAVDQARWESMYRGGKSLSAIARLEGRDPGTIANGLRRLMGDAYPIKKPTVLHAGYNLLVTDIWRAWSAIAANPAINRRELARAVGLTSCGGRVGAIVLYLEAAGVIERVRDSNRAIRVIKAFKYTKY